MDHMSMFLHGLRQSLVDALGKDHPAMPTINAVIFREEVRDRRCMGGQRHYHARLSHEEKVAAIAKLPLDLPASVAAERLGLSADWVRKVRKRVVAIESAPRP